MQKRNVHRIVIAAALAFAVGWSHQSAAIPAFSRQTAEPCTSCHIGAFGPELTGRGRTFKLLGYTEQAGDGPAWWERFSGMVLGSFTNTSRSTPEAKPSAHSGANNNFAMDQASLFYGGRVYDHIGAFIQLTEDGINRRFHVDNVDVRYARQLDVLGVDTILGVSANNNPGVADPYNTLPAWGQPFVASALAPSPIAGAILNGGLAGQVYGASAYARIGGMLYAEAGIYNSLSRDVAHVGGLDPNALQLANPATFWRLAAQHETNRQLFELGAFAMNAALRQPGSGADRFLDWGLDASFQLLGNRTHMFTGYGRWLHEDQTLNGTFGGGNSANLRNHLSELRGNLSYWYQQTYGVTGGIFRTTGSADAILYQAAPVGGSIAGRPNTQGYMAELDWVPFGKADSHMAPWANLKLGLQYTAFSRFNGAGQNYDGFGRSASNNNALYLFAWLAF